jgi:hypothetical protein
MVRLKFECSKEIFKLHEILINLSKVIDIDPFNFDPLYTFLLDNFDDRIISKARTIENSYQYDNHWDDLNVKSIISLKNIQPAQEDSKEDKSWVQCERYCNSQNYDKLLQDLESEDLYRCAIAATQLGKLRRLGKLRNEKAVPSLLNLLDKALKFQHGYANYALEKVFDALGEIGSEQAVPDLVQILEIVNRKNIPQNITWMSGINALGKIGGTAAINGLLEILNTDGSLRYAAVNALEITNDERAIEGLIDALSDKETAIRGRVATVFKYLGSLRHCPKLWEAFLNYEEHQFVDAINAIQSRCGFYNYEIAQSPPPIVRETASFNLSTLGVTIMTDKQPLVNFTQHNPTIGVNYAAEGSHIKFQQNVKNVTEQDLAEAAQKIQVLLNQLAQTYPPTSEPQQQTFIQKFLERLESTPELIKVLLAGGIEGLKILCPPAGIPVEMARRLYEAVQERHSKP